MAARMSSSSSDDDDEDYVPQGTRAHSALNTGALCCTLTPLFVVFSLSSPVVIAVQPTAERKVTSATRSSDKAGGDATEAAQTGRVTASTRVSDLWADINASTSVSQKATDRTAKVRFMHRCVSVSMTESPVDCMK